LDLNTEYGMTLPPKKTAVSILGILYFVGAVGTILNETRALMQLLTPLNLMISSVLLMIYHQGSLFRLFFFLVLSAAIGILAEMIGVHTGLLFGNYQYGETLGFKLAEVPLIIGINWFMLSYAFGIIVQDFKLPSYLKPAIAALLMTLLDSIIEPVATKLDYWTWESNQIPISNFIGWFAIALLIQLLFQKIIKKSENQVAFSLILFQAIYFIIVLIFI